MNQEKIDRINWLSKKSKTEGLTPEELEEQAVLRREYIDDFKKNLKAQLDRIEIVDNDKDDK
ncbi:MAG: DUF896 domain-containing protein [Eubacterium sp.]|nr:DUF896 domain-containing protein [Eubacterium sp.]